MLAKPATLPPFTPFVGGDPAVQSGRSPYKATMEEVVSHFCTTRKRREILAGLIGLRRETRRLAFGARFQWIAGSFVEKLDREPRDVDVVTFYAISPELWVDLQSDAARWAAIVELAKRTPTKARFSCDCFFIDIEGDGETLVGETHYWYGLFSHQRGSFAWKGMIELEVASRDDDQAAEALLAKLVP